MIRLILAAVALSTLGACDDGSGESREAKQARLQRERDWNEPCHDVSTLVATTAGSPNEFECPNKLHRMRVAASTKSGEEVGAVVFCECVRAEEKSK